MLEKWFVVPNGGLVFNAVRNGDMQESTILHQKMACRFGKGNGWPKNPPDDKQETSIWNLF